MTKLATLAALLLLAACSSDGPVYVTKETRFSATGNPILYECTDPCLPLEEFDQVLPASLVVPAVSLEDE